MSTKMEEIRADVKRLTNDLRIVVSMATLKREQAERAEERATELGQQLEAALAKLAEEDPGSSETVKVRLKELLDRSKAIEMTTAEREEQRRDFVYGNTRLSNPAITRELVDDVADKMSRSKTGR
jgi:hypothetical protein